MRKKTRRFAENEHRHNVIQPGKPLYDTVKGHWRDAYFKNNNPIVLELACGRGEYTVGMAPIYPDKNFIGVDIKGDRIWKGSGIAEKNGLQNVAFLRTQILQIENFFDLQEVNEIWIVFPDPRPRDRDDKRRLTHPRFLEIYQRIAKPGSTIHLKTDNTGFFDYTLEVLNSRNDIELLEQTFDLYHSPLLERHQGIRTRYEGIFSQEGHDIKYLTFTFK